MTSGRNAGGSWMGWCCFCGVVAVPRLREVEAGHFGLHAAAKNERSSGLKVEIKKLVASRAEKSLKAPAARKERSSSGQQVKRKKLVGPKGPVEASPHGLLVSATSDELIYINTYFFWRMHELLQL